MGGAGQCSSPWLLLSGCLLHGRMGEAGQCSSPWLQLHGRMGGAAACHLHGGEGEARAYISGDSKS